MRTKNWCLGELLKQSLIVFIAPAVVLTACTSATITNSSNTDSGQQQSVASVTPPYPGPFKLMNLKEPDGTYTEYWVARGEIGNHGGTLRLSSIGSGPKTFNPWDAKDATSSSVGQMLFEHLLDIDAWTGKPYPRLARSFSVSPDNKDYTITLRRGLKWSDGMPLTADDVVFTFNNIVAKGYGNSSTRDVLSVYGQFPQVEKIDDLTVKFHTKVPFAPFLISLSGVPIAPKHVMQQITQRPISEFSNFWDINSDPQKMVVSGLFKLARYIPAQRLEFVRNSNFKMVDKQGRNLPYLNKLTISIVPDQNTQALKFYAGEIDLLEGIRGSDAALMKQREQSYNFRMYNLGPDDGTQFLCINMNRRKNPKSGKYYVDPIKQNWFNNLYFRQALTHTVDRQRMVDNILRGVGKPLFTCESPVSVYFNKDLPAYPQDLTLAANLLSKGGFHLRDSQLFDSDGHKVEFTLNTNAGNTLREPACIMIANDLQKLGIKVNYQPLEFNILVDKLSQSLDWDAIVMGLTGSKLEPYDGANVWKSNGRLHMFDQRLPNKTGTVIVTDARDWEKKIDQLFDQGATTFDEKARHKFFDEYQSIIYEQQPFIYLYSGLNITAARNTLGNYTPTPLGSLFNLEEIYFKSTNTSPGSH